MTTIGGLTVLDPPDNYWKGLLHGPQGSGKTYLASTIAQLGRTLLVDMIGERGTRAFKDAAWEDRIDVVQPTTIQQLDDLYWDFAGGGHDYVAVIIDSLTAVQNSAIRFILGRSETAVAEIKRGGASMRIQDWGDLRDIMADITTFWYGLADGDRDQPYHVVMTSQTRFPGGTEEDSSEKATLELSGGGRSFALSTPDYVLFTDREEDLTASPDDDGEYPERFLLRIVSQRASTKARIPVSLRGRIPNTLGRGEQPLSLPTIGRALRVGGMTPPPASN